MARALPLAQCGVLLCALGVSLVAGSLSPTPVLQTALGPIQGVYNDASGINMYKGIPFAAPPLGDLRFADTQPPQSWTNVLNASAFSPGCMARCPPVGFPRPELMCTPTISEDCLYLNVFAPAKTSEPLTKREHRQASAEGGLPVIMFIHGGNYMFGSGGVPIYDGQQLARSQHVVVVTINYRLNVFGALYTGSNGIDGNFHLKDQIMAMKWVRDNIAAFGGDSARVTISGQSAGAYSVATHLTLPASAGLFQRAIIVSNPATLLAANPTDAMQLGTKVSNKLGCGESGSVEQLRCLRNASADAILNVSTTDYSFDPHTMLDDMMQWVPVVDGTFVPRQQLDAFESGNFTRVPVFFGTVANESIEFIFKLDEKPMSAFTLDVLLSTIFGIETASRIRQQYGPIPESMKSDVRPYLEVLTTDFVFWCVNRKIGSYLTQHVPTYIWMYDYLSYMNEWIFGKSMPFCVKNVCHAEDLSSIFFPTKWIEKFPGEPYPPPQKEVDLADIVQTAWGNFAYNGDPNPIEDGLGPTSIVPGTRFPQFNATQNAVVNYSTPTSNLVGYRNEICDFWDTVGYRTRR